MSTAGTNTFSKRSVNRWVGERSVSAWATIWTTRASVVSPAGRVTTTSSAPDPLSVPAKTRCSGATSPRAARAGAGPSVVPGALAAAASAASRSGAGRLSTGTLSPVTGAWSTALVPAATTPSAAIRSSGRTTTVSPTRRSPTGTSVSTPPRRTRAVAGASSPSASMARRALPIA